MLVAHIANTNPPTIDLQDDVRVAARRLVESRCTVLPVLVADERGPRVVGLLRDRDLFTAAYGRGSESGTMTVAAAMSPAPCTCRASDSLGSAVRLLRRNGVDALPVVDGRGYFVGVLSFADLVRHAMG